MDPRSILAKTELGQEEIASRTRRVPARQRSLLIMIDGRRTAGELLANHPVPEEAEEHLNALIEGGFIVATETAAASAPAQAEGLGGGGGGREADLKEVKREITVLLMDAIGPDADFFAVKVDNARDRDELRREAEKLQAMIRANISPHKADKFQERIATLLG